jgi:hypothetical protein
MFGDAPARWDSERGFIVITFYDVFGDAPARWDSERCRIAP